MDGGYLAAKIAGPARLAVYYPECRTWLSYSNRKAEPLMVDVYRLRNKGAVGFSVPEGARAVLDLCYDGPVPPDDVAAFETILRMREEEHDV